MSMLPTNTDQRSDPLIASFEEEQKTIVFSALSEYWNQSLFCDVSLVVGHQVLGAHKVVLSSTLSTATCTVVTTCTYMRTLCDALWDKGLTACAH